MVIYTGLNIKVVLTMSEIYIRKPEEVEAVRWDGTNIDELRKLGLTLGFHMLNIGDFVVKNVEGELSIYDTEGFRKYFKRKLVWDDNI